jgi:hypothetical protein
MKLSTKGYQDLTLAYLDSKQGVPCTAGPSDLKVWGVLNINPITGGSYMDALTADADYNSNSANGARNLLIRKGVLIHPCGNKDLWQRANLSPEAAAFISMGVTDRRKLLREKWNSTPTGEVLWDAVVKFDKINEQSPFFNAAIQFPEGTADGLLSASADRYLAQRSHIIDRFISRAIGFGTWDRAANVLLEHAVINLARYHSRVTTSFTDLTYGVVAGTELGKGLDFTSGQSMRVLPELAQTYRKAFRLRQDLLAMLESDSVLKEALEVFRSQEVDEEGE